MVALHQERRPRRLYRLHFATPGFEEEFRGWQRQRYRTTRMLLFGVFALTVLLTPLFGVTLFEVGADAQPLLRAIHWRLMLPAALCGVAAGFVRGIDLARGLQTAAVLGLWGGILAMRWLSLHGAWNYASPLLALGVLGVALFGGYSWRRVASGTLLFASLSIAIESRAAAPGSHAALQIYTLVAIFATTLAGAFSHELMSRLIWLNHRYNLLMAATDRLTGLANHYEFHRSLERVLAHAAREQRALAVALIDLDHFKSINDRYGHLFGDRVLRDVGALLRNEVARRPLDVRARYGGEELAILWYDVKPAAVPGLVESVLDQLRNLPFSDPASGQRVRVTASAGACWLVPNETTRPEDVLHCADLLLYCAKSEGRDRGCLAPFNNALQTISATPAAPKAVRSHVLHGDLLE